MEEIIIQANYVVSLIAGETTEEIRAEYAKTINNYDDAINCFELILENLLQRVKEVTPEELQNLIEVEYEGIGLNKYLGNFDIYIEFIKFLIKVVLLESEEGDRLNILKEGVHSVRNLNEEIKYTVHYVTLSSLVYGDLIKEDVDFAKMLINCVQNSTVKDTKALFRVFHQVINRTNR